MAGIQTDILYILRQRAEMALSGKLDAVESRYQEDVEQLFHELQVYQLELEMQIDELRVSSEALEIQKNKFKLLFDLAPVGYMIIDRRGIIADINQAGIALLDIAGRRAVINKPLSAFIESVDIKAFYLFLNQLFESGETQHQVLHLVDKKQAKICVQISGIIYREAGHEPVCYLMLTDISELREAESKLNLAKQKLEIALDASMTGIWEVDTGNGHIFLDDFCQGIFDFEPFGFDNRIESLLSRIHPEDRQPFESGLRKAIVTNSPFLAEFRVQNHDTAHIKYIQARAGAAGSKRFIGIMIDFSEKRELEIEAKQLEAQREQMVLAAAIEAEEKEKKRTSEALHDGVAQQLYALKLSLDSYKNSMGGEYYRFDELLNNTITELRNISFELTPAILMDFGLNETLKEMANRLSGANLHISLKLSPDLKKLETGLQLCIYRMVQELVNNCIKHSKAGHIAIDIKQNGDSIAIRVADDGCGFEIKKNKRHIAGTGFASIRNRLKLYNGTLTISSKINKGTSVDIILKQFA